MELSRKTVAIIVAIIVATIIIFIIAIILYKLKKAKDFIDNNYMLLDNVRPIDIILHPILKIQN